MSLTLLLFISVKFQILQIAKSTININGLIFILYLLLINQDAFFEQVGYNLNQMQLSTNLIQLFKRLQATIMRLQSDDLIEQMRNDSSLYACKMKYIQEIIEEEINSCAQLEESLLLAEALQQKLKDRENVIERMKNQYAVQLENIEHNCRQLIFENQKKLKEKEDNLHKFKHEVSSLQANIIRFENSAKIMRQEVSKLKNENNSLKQDKKELEQIRSELEERINSLRRENSEKNRSSEGALKETYESMLNQVVNYYGEIMQKMQKDMGFIKEGWEKFFLSLQSRHQQELALRAIQAEEKFKKELIEYADNLKMGSSVVFSNSEEIMSKKVELIQRKYKIEISKLGEEIKQMEQQMSQIKDEMEQKQEQIAQLNHTLEQMDEEHQKEVKSLQASINTKDKQIQTLKSQNDCQQEEINKIKRSIQEKSIESKQLKEELSVLNKQHGQIKVKLAGQQQQLEECKKTLASQIVKTQDYKNQLSRCKQSIAQKQQSIHLNTNDLTNLKNHVESLKETISNQKYQLDEYIQKVKREKEKRKIVIERLDKFHIFIRKMGKELKILKQEVLCTVQVLNNKLSTQFSLLNDSIAQRNESLMKKHKAQMSQLLDEMQQKQKELSENLAAQKDQLRLDMKQYQEMIKERDNDLYKLKQFIADLEQEKKEILLDLQTYKVQSIRLEEKIQANQQSYVSQITKAEKEISRCMSNFNSHWSDQIGRIIQEMEVKDARIKLLTDKIDEMNAQSEEGKRQRTWMEEEIKKYKKKYQNFKQQRDEKIEALLKKLQQESKHRLNLEKQLKQVRMTIMKGTYQSNNNFSFNDKERQSNNKPFTTSSKEDHHKEREQELSEIRQMIAKTYKVVDKPAEKDIGRNFSKKALF